MLHIQSDIKNIKEKKKMKKFMYFTDPNYGVKDSLGTGKIISVLNITGIRYRKDNKA